MFEIILMRHFYTLIFTIILFQTKTQGPSTNQWAFIKLPPKDIRIYEIILIKIDQKTLGMGHIIAIQKKTLSVLPVISYSDSTFKINYIDRWENSVLTENPKIEKHQRTPRNVPNEEYLEYQLRLDQRLEYCLKVYTNDEKIIISYDDKLFIQNEDPAFYKKFDIIEYQEYSTIKVLEKEIELIIQYKHIQTRYKFTQNRYSFFQPVNFSLNIDIPCEKLFFVPLFIDDESFLLPIEISEQDVEKEHNLDELVVLQYKIMKQNNKIVIILKSLKGTKWFNTFLASCKEGMRKEFDLLLESICDQFFRNLHDNLSTNYGIQLEAIISKTLQEYFLKKLRIQSKGFSTFYTKIYVTIINREITTFVEIELVSQVAEIFDCFKNIIFFLITTTVRSKKVGHPKFY